MTSILFIASICDGLIYFFWPMRSSEAGDEAILKALWVNYAKAVNEVWCAEMIMLMMMMLLIRLFCDTLLVPNI